MSDKEDDLLADPLFVGLTRPTMIGGVTFQGIMLNMMITTGVFMVTKNPLHLGVALPIHAVFYGICAHDPRAFELLGLWFRTKFDNQLSRWFRPYWKASSYTPLPFKERS